ncbi:MAG: glycosyl hydrolase, partial [Candidatus Omnitrophica bacterium]|nr:glycosyl hydrolase [Candidatus Omnitrophota bacterium]
MTSRISSSLIVSLLSLVAVWAGPKEESSPAITEVMLKGLKARSIGPAVMSGRVSDIAIDPRNPYTFYLGLATGGVWKTGNNGVTFAPVFDDQPVQSIGAVAIAPSNADIVWVGTGEGSDRNSAGWGNGVYRSSDAGGKWSRMGLKTSCAICRIVIHPTRPDTVYAAAAGSLWSSGGERGLYQTTDGGKTWKLVLAAPKPYDAVTGCSDIAMDPRNPDTLYAALYARQRKPWGFYYGTNLTDGADVGGVFKSTDAGTHWTKLTYGLPGSTGRIGLAVSQSKPGVVMAVVQSDQGGTSDIDQNHSRAGGVFRSEDAGATWRRMNSLDPRPFYFSRLDIDPANDQRVYVLGWILYVSDNAGRTFREADFDDVHVDVHALAIQPGTALPPKSDESKEKEGTSAPPVSQRLITGTDGGAYQTFDGSKNWDFLNMFPAGQYYRITLDNSTPYRIAGGLQDNSNWVGPSRTFTKEGIRNADWTMIGGGDGFYCVFDPDDRNILYAESQGGEVYRFNGRTGEMRGFAPRPAEGQPRFRFQWNSPLIGSRHYPGVMYLGGNHVFKLTHRA